MTSSPFLEQVRTAMRLKHLSYKTEQAYVQTIKRFIFFHDKRHPSELGVPEIRGYLAYLATDRHVSASTQNGALSALLFLYREVLHVDLPFIDGIRYRTENMS
jgi:site-specific recombinase XerD